MKIKIFRWSLQFEWFNSKVLPFNFLFYFLLLTFFFQTRYAFFARHEIVDYLIPFVYLSDVLIILLLVRSLRSLKSLRNKRWLFLFFCFFVFLFFTAISNLSAAHPLSAWCHWFKVLEFGAFAFWVAWYISNQQSAISNQQKIYHLPLTTYYLLAFGLAFQCLIAIGEFVLQRSLGLQILGEWRFSILTPGIAKVILFGKEFLRPYATFPHPNVLGGILAIMAPVNLHLAFTRKFEVRNSKFQTNSKHEILNRFLTSRSLLTIYYLLFTFTLLLTFSRSAWLAYLVLIVAILVFWGWKSRKGVKGIKGINLKRPVLYFLFFVLCSLFFPFVYQRIKSLQTTDVLSVERRVELNRAAIAMLRDHPIFGVGLGNFIPNLEDYLTVSGQGRFLQPVHNVPLLILAETGLFGFTAFFLFIVVLLYSFVRKVKNKKEFCTLHFEFCTLLMWSGIFIISLFDHYFWTLQSGQLFFWLTVGLTIGYNIK